MQKWIYAAAKKKSDGKVQAFCYGDAPVHFVEIPGLEIVNDFGYTGPQEYLRFQIDSRTNEVRFATWISKERCENERLLSHSGSLVLDNSKSKITVKIITITVAICFTFLLGVTIYSLNREPTIVYTGSSSWDRRSQERELEGVRNDLIQLRNALIDYYSN